MNNLFPRQPLVLVVFGGWVGLPQPARAEAPRQCQWSPPPPTRRPPPTETCGHISKKSGKHSRKGSANICKGIHVTKFTLFLHKIAVIAFRMIQIWFSYRCLWRSGRTGEGLSVVGFLFILPVWSTVTSRSDGGPPRMRTERSQAWAGRPVSLAWAMASCKLHRE